MMRLRECSHHFPVVFVEKRSTRRRWRRRWWRRTLPTFSKAYSSTVVV
jgi:hypothetical protein|tara:strand:- start:2235 stop:2378 length:144 start_codon:yes stop_codon:yes gene_type:complete